MIIATTIATDITKSRRFFEEIDWKIIERNKKVYACEKGIVLELNTDKKARPGLKFYGVNSQTIKELAKIVFVEELPDSYIMNDPSGTWVYVMKTENLAYFEDVQEPSILGTYAGISLECIDAVKAIEFYKTLGLEPAMGNIETGWEALKSPEGFGLSVMKANQCPHSFTNPSFTYFNSGKNEEIIAKIRQKKIPITEEITIFNDKNIVDNVILHEPGGYGFFIFND